MAGSHPSDSYIHGNMDPHAVTVRSITVESQRKELNTIFLKLRIADSTGHAQNIHFPFDIEADTSISVATEMVVQLDLTDQDVTAIAEMIDAEIRAHIPDWALYESVDNQGNEVTILRPTVQKPTMKLLSYVRSLMLPIMVLSKNSFLLDGSTGQTRPYKLLCCVLQLEEVVAKTSSGRKYS